MKSELALAIFAAIAGVLISYFVCNIFIGEIESFSFDTISSEVSTDLSEPSPDVFNYRALNPTVEIYIGSCNNYDNATGTCLDEVTTEDVEAIEELETEEE